MSTATVTEDDLMQAYERTDLKRLGITFERALEDKTLRACLSSMSRADAEWARRALRTGRTRMDFMNRD
ncbi:MAG: hypothetical protein HGA47_00120 [Zoogloea sp.]|nr:hypothetical protein [Zoogloea sp.]